MFDFLSFSASTWTLLALLFTLVLLFGIWPFRILRNAGIPGPTPLPFFGTTLYFRQGFEPFDRECQKKYGEVWGLYDGRQPLIMVSDPEVVKTVMVKECYSAFTNRRRGFFEGPMADSILNVKDERWKRIRNTLSPCFTSGRLKQAFSIVSRYADRLIGTLEKKNLNESMDIKAFVSPYSFDVVTSASFSIETDAINDPNGPVITHMKKMLNFRPWLFSLFMMFPSCTRIFNALGLSIFPKESVDFFFDIIKKFKDQHKSDTTTKGDFLQVFIQNEIPDIKNPEEQPSKGLTQREILSQAIVFIFGGFDTTSVTLSYLLYNLAINQEVLQKLHKEIDAGFPKDTPLSYEGIMNLQYLDQVFHESQRVTPTAPRLERHCKKTVQLHGITVPEGTMVGIPVSLLHKDPRYWENPEEFKPERFSKDREISPYVFLPFGQGPRNCIGERFAIMTMKTVVVRLLQKYTLQTSKETVIPMKLDFRGQPKTPIKLKIVPRKFQ